MANDNSSNSSNSNSNDTGSSRAKRDEPEVDNPTHRIFLSDGNSVPSAGAIPTHYADGDTVYKVVMVTELEP